MISFQTLTPLHTLARFLLKGPRYIPKGMPSNGTWLTGTYMYYHAFESHNVDYSSAISVLIVILGVITAKIVNAVFKEKDY